MLFRFAAFGLFLVIPLTLSSCAPSSGILKMGPDTYSVSVSAGWIRGGANGARRLAYSEANEKCAQDGKEILVTNFRHGQPTEVTFRCLDKGDPELKRPNFQSDPDTVIEDRRK